MSKAFLPTILEQKEKEVAQVGHGKTLQALTSDLSSL